MRKPMMSGLLALVLIAGLALPASADTLILRDGRRFTGTLTSANRSSITFLLQQGGARRFWVRDVQVVRFGDGPYRDNPNDQDYRPTGNYPGSSDNRPYDRGRMERVIIPAGTEIQVLTNENIDGRNVVEGRTFAAQIQQDLLGPDGYPVIQRGSDARLVVTQVERDGDFNLDLESVVVDGRRFAVSTTDVEVEGRRNGIGTNRRTGAYVGGGAVLGTIIGAIAGGGRGAAIGALAGAGTGAAVQLTTRGRGMRIPAETVLRFRLDYPLRLRLVE